MMYCSCTGGGSHQELWSASQPPGTNLLSYILIFLIFINLWVRYYISHFVGYQGYHDINLQVISIF